MGGYYKLKKILIILCITLTTLRIINNSRVFASEAVEVTPVWNDGDYTYQADNQFLTLRQNQIDVQDSFINFCYIFYDIGTETQRTTLKRTLNNLYANIVSSSPSSSYFGGTNTRFVYFSRVLTSLGGVNTYAYTAQCLRASVLNNIVYADATLDSGYKILSVPFYTFTRSNENSLRYIDSHTGDYMSVTTGTAQVPVAEVGCYSTRWIDLFDHVGLIHSTADYNSILSSIENTNELNYTANYYTQQAVENTYSYITNDDIDTISSLGFSQPNNSEDIDLTDCFDELEALLTGENYTNKSFTFSIPGNRNYTFSIAPTMLETNLTRVGGSAIISIIHAMWYIGLFGWYIFAYLGIWGKFLSGDWLHLVNHTSPVNKIVKMSVSTFGGGS